jgi:hypothetical protein
MHMMPCYADVYTVEERRMGKQLLRTYFSRPSACVPGRRALCVA